MSTKYRFGNPETPHFITLTLVEWIDLFSREKYKQLKVHAYVIMTNHLHLIVSTSAGTNLATIIQNFKRHMASLIYKSLLSDCTESRRQWMLWILRHQGKKSSSNKNVKVWRHENHPILLDMNHLIDQKLTYIHENPIKAGICYTPEDYKYSSAGVYAGEAGLLDISLLV